MTGTYQGFPRSGSKIVEPDGTLTQTWRYFFFNLWRSFGGSSVNLGAVVVLQYVAGVLQAIGALSGTPIATVITNNSVGGLPLGQIVPASPWVFTAPATGVLAISSGQIEIGRNGNKYVVGLMGGSPSLMKNDTVTVTWFNSAPTVTWLPAT